MKKVFLFIFVFVSALCLTACQVSDESVDNILKSFQDQDIVSNELVLVDEVVKVNAGILPSNTKYYVYATGDSDLLAICYKKSSDNSYDYLVTIYSTVTVKENIDYYSGDTGYLDFYYKYSDGKVSKNNKYEFEGKRVYEVNEYKGLIFKDRYKICNR